MQNLFNDLCEGLKAQGYKEQGGSDLFRIFEKDGNGIKLYMDGLFLIKIRYYYKDEENNND